MRKLFIFSLLLIAISGINAQNRKLRANLLDKNNHSVMVVSCLLYTSPSPRD